MRDISFNILTNIFFKKRKWTRLFVCVCVVFFLFVWMEKFSGKWNVRMCVQKSIMRNKNVKIRTRWLKWYKQYILYWNLQNNYHICIYKSYKGSTKPLFKLVTYNLSAVKTELQSYCDSTCESDVDSEEL